jgi:NitT/TauT family transport system permease protein
VLLVLMCLLWEWYARHLSNPLMLPTFSNTLKALTDALVNGTLPARILVSLKTLIVGYGIGVLLAVAAALAPICWTCAPPCSIPCRPSHCCRWHCSGSDSVSEVSCSCSCFVHAVLWPVALSAHAGFAGINPTIRMVGSNYGLSGFRYVTTVLIPAAFPSLLTGLRNGWAFAWRTLIAAELVFGVSSGSGGIGWFIYENKNQLEIPAVFAGLITVIVIGIAVENLVFNDIEQRTVVRRGMKNNGHDSHSSASGTK